MRQTKTVGLLATAGMHLLVLGLAWTGRLAAPPITPATGSEPKVLWLATAPTTSPTAQQWAFAGRHTLKNSKA